jgi:RNA polymerase sigma-70 factor, ECF subfamily
MTGTDDSDEALLGRYRGGDEEAGRVLFARLSSELRPRARRRIAPALRARVGESDLIQAAFGAVLSRLHEFRDLGPGSFRRWIGTVMDRKAIDEHRRRHGRDGGRAKELRLDALSDCSTPSAPGTTPSGVAMADEDRKELRAALDHLAPDYRTVLRLVHESKMSMGAAAAAMGRTYEATKKLYARALERLERSIRDGGAS